MYISQMPHFLDETGAVPKQVPKEALYELDTWIY